MRIHYLLRLALAAPSTLLGQRLQASVNISSLEQDAEYLYGLSRLSAPLINRAIDTAGHNATVGWISRSLTEWGYNVTTQRFVARVPKTKWTFQAKSAVVTEALKFSPLTIARGVVVQTDSTGCVASDYTKNSVGVVRRGQCTFAAKAKAAHEACAKAVIVTDDKAFNGTMREEAPVPVFSMSNEDAAHIVSQEATIQINLTTRFIETFNVIAETFGGNHSLVVMLGAHSDSVETGPGINDNGSGIISLMTVARALSREPVNNAIRFSWWSAEEAGLLGSDYYTAHLAPAEGDKIVMFLDFDMVALPNFAYQVYKGTDEGSIAITNKFADWYKSNQLPYDLIEMDGRSDYVGFVNIGIPSGGVTTGAEKHKSSQDVDRFEGTTGPYDKCYHLACDDLTNLNYDAWLVNTRLIAAVTGDYAVSLDGFPRRDTVAATDTATGAATTAFTYHGDLVM